MGTRKIKTRILQILEEPDLLTIFKNLAPYPAKETINVLFTALCSGDELIRWHGISAMGSTISRLADENMEEARIIMRRLLWSLNDESGGIGWGAPESMAEAMYHHNGLAREYMHMLVSYTREDGEEKWQDGNFLEHEILQRGLLWGIGRLSQKRKEELLHHGILDSLIPYLTSPDGTIRGLAAWSLGFLGDTNSTDALNKLIGDHDEVRLYNESVITIYSVDELARQALKRLEA